MMKEPKRGKACTWKHFHFVFLMFLFAAHPGVISLLYFMASIQKMFIFPQKKWATVFTTDTKSKAVR